MTVINPFRSPLAQRPGLGLWEVHRDPYDVSRIWVRNHHHGGWIQATWTYLNAGPVPFGDLAWDHAQRMLARRGIDKPTEEQIAQAAGDLLDRAERGPERPPACQDAPVSTASILTSDSYERLVAGLRGRTIVAVDYFVLTGGDKGTEPDEWDYGAWHEPTMGVELTMDDGSTYSAVWGSTFDYYGVELYPAPMRDFLSRVDEPGGSARVAVAEHPLWAGIISAPIESCRVQWCGEEHGAPTPVPDAIHVQTAAGQAWIAAGRSATYEPDGPFHLGTGDVLVIFDTDVAVRAGIRA